MNTYRDNLFTYIIETLVFASTRQSNLGGFNTLGIGSYIDLADHLNAVGRLSPRGRKWTAHSIESWLKRYCRDCPGAREAVDWDFVGAAEWAYRNGLDRGRQVAGNSRTDWSAAVAMSNDRYKNPKRR